MLVLTPAFGATRNPAALDRSFGGDGRVFASFTAGIDLARDVAVQPDGKLLVSGDVGRYLLSDIAVARFNRDGARDTRFGQRGLVRQTIGRRSRDETGRVAVQSDGRILLAGATHDLDGNRTVGDSAIVVARYTADGMLDRSFGSGGRIVIKRVVNGSLYFDVTDVSLAPDGKIVVAGMGDLLDERRGRVVVARLTASGRLDRSFGSGGVVRTRPSAETHQVYGMAVQRDGKVVVAGMSFFGGDRDFYLLRLAANGRLDRRFGRNGVVRTQFGNDPEGAHALVLQPDGKLVAAGFTLMPEGRCLSTCYRLALARYRPDGALDASFGGDGKVVTEVELAASDPMDLALDEGKLVVLAQAYAPNRRPDFLVMRLHADGAPDRGFGRAGVVTSDMRSSAFDADLPQSLAIRPDGRIVAVGASAKARPGNAEITKHRFAIVQYVGDSRRRRR